MPNSGGTGEFRSLCFLAGIKKIIPFSIDIFLELGENLHLCCLVVRSFRIRNVFVSCTSSSCGQRSG